MIKDFIYIGLCDRKNKEHRFRKCNGHVIRIKAPFKNKRFIDEIKISHVEYCVKCDVVHMLWVKGELEDIVKLVRLTEGKND